MKYKNKVEDLEADAVRDLALSNPRFYAINIFHPDKNHPY